jgi:hypothetical protein
MTDVRRPELAGLRIADPPQRWRALGFAVDENRPMELGGIEVELGVPGRGIVGWTLRHIAPRSELDGLATGTTELGLAPPVAHPNGATGIDHVVLSTPEFDRTSQALADAGLPLRRIRDAGSLRQGFRRLGPAILELVEAPDAAPGPARLWALVIVAADLQALRSRLHPHLGQVRAAVQPGRHIATLDAGAGLSPRVAFMDPEPPANSRVELPSR